MSEPQQQKPRGLKENMGGFFHEMLRAAGVTMTPVGASEKIREIGERLATTVEVTAEKSAIKVIKRLQTAVTTAFLQMEEEMSQMKQLLTEQQALIKGVMEQLAAIKAVTEHQSGVSDKFRSAIADLQALKEQADAEPIVETTTDEELPEGISEQIEAFEQRKDKLR